MLIRFVVSNFLSFDEETEFNMLAGNFKQHKQHVYKVGKLKVLRAAAIYGANAAGKSNLIKAIDTLKNIVEEGGVFSFLEQKKFKLNPANKEKPIQFEMEFSIKNKIYAYGISINKGKIKEEWLYESGITKEDKLIFERTTDKKGKINIRLGKRQLSAKQKLLIELLEENLIKEDETVIGKFELLKIREVTMCRNWIADSLLVVYPQDKPSNFFINRFIVSEGGKEGIENIVKILDLGIATLKTELIEGQDYFGKDYEQDYFEEIMVGVGEDRSIIYHEENGLLHLVKIDDKLYVEKVVSLHKGTDGNVEFNLEEESLGTQRMVDFIPLFFLMLVKDMVVLIDEIDQSLHVNLLYRFLEESLKNEDAQGQLIFTTHESNLLDLNILRPDEIWFAEKDRSKGSTQFYSLSEFKPRYDLDIRKGYLQGRYGAIPFLADLENLNWSSLATKEEESQNETNQSNA
ncbi:AAA family ATPase [Bernardetia sp.]|uniref:AAA family ATPase n=1 Tax=Bernardetia sp. TaxID=1937974 RepID=UPI0025C35A36|nr:ATP-binding protein [Bernardetia sp.]